MSSRGKKLSSASSRSSRVSVAGRAATKTPTSMSQSPTASSSVPNKSVTPQRKISQASSQGQPTGGRKMSQSSATSSSRRMSHMGGVTQGVVSSTKRKTSDDDAGGMASLKQSFQSLMITKRMARRVRQRTSQRLADRRGVSFVSYIDRPRRRSPSAKHLPQVENTYQLEPHEPFSSYERIIHDIVQSLVESWFSGMKYDPQRCSIMAQELSDIIKERVKTLDIARYKLITVVNIGKMLGQGMRVCSRNSWDPARDSFVSYHFQNDSLFCVATVYGIYFE